jgi:hypothetical protein
MFKDFSCGKLDLYRLNFALSTIIPKGKDARTMNKFRPISLLNCSYKIFIKVLTNRISGTADKLVASNQTTFIKGRYILESVVTAHEVLHSVHQSKQQGLVLKLDYEKTYDKVNWVFLLDVLEKRGFGARRMGWIKEILYRGSVGVTVNNMEGEFFETGKGLMQGDPLSLILFKFVVVVLSRMLQNATRVNLTRGLGEDLIEGGVVSLQYADDTILFLGKEEECARNLKWILTYFEMMPEMRINYHKSELIPVGDLEIGEMQLYSNIFGCPVGGFPLNILEYLFIVRNLEGKTCNL